MSLLCVQDLKVQFQDQSAAEEVVNCFSVAADPGEIVGIVGESGSGKSTAMLAILGLLPEYAQVTTRQMTLAGKDIAAPITETGKRKNKKQWQAYEQMMEKIRGNDIGMIFQDPLTCLNPTVKIGRQIAEAIRVHQKCTRAEAEKRALELLEAVGIKHKKRRLQQYPFELSGGIRQRIVIAIALANEPKVIIADEPTTALDATIQQQILKMLKEIAGKTKTAILLVSHDLGVIASIADRVIVMQKGSIVESGTVREVFNNPRREYTRKLVRLAGYAQEFRLETEPGLKPVHSLNRPVLELKHLDKRYWLPAAGSKPASMEAVSGLSLTIGAGETFGLVGESGCGKTTLAGLIMGIQKPDGGTIYYRDMNILPGGGNGKYRRKNDNMKTYRKKVQMIFQDPYASLDPRCTIGETVAEPLVVNRIGTRAEQNRRVGEMLCLVGLSAEDARKYPHAFSGGQRQRIGIARALIMEPELLICDEPVASMDVTIQEQILKLLEQIQREKGISCLFISHDLKVVRRISQRIGVMYAGRLIETGDTKEVYEQPWHPYTKALLAAARLPGNFEAVQIPLPEQSKRTNGLTLPSGRRHLQEKSTACPFAGICQEALPRCHRERPGNYQTGARSVSCFIYENTLHQKGTISTS